MRGRQPPPLIGAVIEAVGDHPVHVESRVDPKGNRIYYPSSNSKGEHRQTGHWPSGIAMEGGGGNN